MRRNQCSIFFLILLLVLPLVTTWAQTSLWSGPAMEYIDVGDTPDQVRRMSKLIMGTDHLGKVPNEQTVEVLNEAVRLGINTFDTAPIYAESIEVRFGAWIRAQNRSDLHVITKGGFPRDLGPGTYYSRLRGTHEQMVANVFEQLRWSRKNYDDNIAIYLMHRDDDEFHDYGQTVRPRTPARSILAALSDPWLKRSYAMIGVSNWETARVKETQRAAAEHPELMRPVCNSPYFSLLEMGPVTIHSGGVQVTHADMMNPEFQKGVKLMTYSPLGGFSILSKGWEQAKQNALALKNARDRYWGNVHDAIFHEANEKRFHRAQKFTADFNTRHGTNFTLDQMFNAYVIAHPRTDFVIIGPRTVEQLRRTVQALELAKMLTPEDLDFLYNNQ